MNMVYSLLQLEFQEAHLIRDLKVVPEAYTISKDFEIFFVNELLESKNVRKMQDKYPIGFPQSLDLYLVIVP